MPRTVQPVEQIEEHKEEKRTATHKPAHAHRRQEESSYGYYLYGHRGHQRQLLIDSHSNGRWNTRKVTAATEELEVDGDAGSHDVQERRRQVNKAKQVRLCK